MYRRPHHNKIAAVLEAMDPNFLLEAKSYFGGGTAISLQLDEYRQSDDIDFVCADTQGYRRLRESVFENGLREMFPAGIEALREVRSDRDGVRTFLKVQDTPIKFEIVLEGRVSLQAASVEGIPVPCICRDDLYVEKLLANVDRYLDRGVMSRDVIDLMVMEARWGAIPATAWSKAEAAYGSAVREAWDRARAMLRGDPAYFEGCLRKMAFDERVAAEVRNQVAKRPSQPRAKRP